MYMYSLSERLASTNIVVSALHPGVVSTELYRNYENSTCINRCFMTLWSCCCCCKYLDRTVCYGIAWHDFGIIKLQAKFMYHIIDPRGTSMIHSSKLLRLWYEQERWSSLLLNCTPGHWQIVACANGPHQFEWSCCDTRTKRIILNDISIHDRLKRKRKRSDSVLWQKPLYQKKIQKNWVMHKITTKTSITQRLHLTRL